MKEEKTTVNWGRYRIS